MEALVAKIESMGDDVHGEIERLIQEAGIPYSCNNKYTFVDMSLVPEETLQEIVDIVNEYSIKDSTDPKDEMTISNEEDTVVNDECLETPKNAPVYEIKTKKKTQQKKSFIVSGKRQEQYDAQQNDLDIETKN